MGVIARQGFKAAIVTYGSVLIGVINQILIYPSLLSVEQYGEIQFVLQTAAFFSPFILFGLNAVLTRFYPVYAGEDSAKQSLYGSIFLPLAINMILFLGAFFLFREQITSHYTDGSSVAPISILILFLIGALLPWLTIFKTIAAQHGRIAIPSLFDQLIKIYVPILAFLFYTNYISFNTLIPLLLAYYVLLVLMYGWYARKRDNIKPSFSIREIGQRLDYRAMFAFGFFSLFTAIGTTLANQIDIVMITAFKGTHQTGLYSWGLFIANAIALPYGLMITIATPIIARHWKNNDTSSINRLYKSSASSLTIISITLFFCVWLAIDDLFKIMPKGDEFRFAKWLVLLLCVSKIVDLSTGLNSHILSMSSKYKTLLWFLMISAIVNVGLNWVLIPEYGIEGSGIATLTSILIFNALKFFYIRARFNMNPLTTNTLIIIGMACGLYFGISLIPKTSMSLLNLVIYPGLFFVVYGFLTYRLKLSPEINEFVNKQLRRIGIQPFD